jgi:WXXGXW repeat (2 copies)
MSISEIQLGNPTLEIMPFNPRNPQQHGITGHAKDHRAKGNTMRIFSSIRYSLFALVLLALSAAAYGQIGISISLAPPELPTFEQPLCPGDGYLWTPGYWAYADTDTGYYWVPGAWVLAPEPNFLWTPGYWGWGGNGYAFNEGYWGLHVGFYGGVSYGYGYFGNGYEGGRWQEGHFFYNRSVNNVNITNIHNVYNTTLIHNNVETRVSYNGGSGGIDRRPTAEEESFSHERHVPPVAAQNEHAQAARANPEQRASVIHGSPAGAARPEAARPEAARPETARSEDTHPETAHPEIAHPENAATHTVVHPNDLPAREPFAAPNSGNAARDQKLEQQHTQMIAKQDQERQQLQQKQDQEHQRQATQKTDDAGKQRLEQQHQQQTQKLQQKHTQQEQKMQSKVPPAAPKHA